MLNEGVFAVDVVSGDGFVSRCLRAPLLTVFPWQRHHGILVGDERKVLSFAHQIHSKLAWKVVEGFQD